MFLFAWDAKRLALKLILTGTLGPTALLFSESPSRIIISFDPADANAVQEIAERNNAPFAILGALVERR